MTFFKLATAAALVAASLSASAMTQINDGLRQKKMARQVSRKRMGPCPRQSCC